MSDAVLVAIISTGLSPALLLILTRMLDRRNEERATKLARLVEQTKTSNTEEHGSTAALVLEVRDEVRAHREEFIAYRDDHTREHQLINQIITH